MEWIKLADEDIPEVSRIGKAKLSGRTVCLIWEDSVLYVTGAKCPHAGADLSRGWCKDGKLICPFHRHAFDLKTGRGDPGQGNYVRVYPVEERADGWYVGIEKSWWKSIF